MPGQCGVRVPDSNTPDTHRATRTFWPIYVTTYHPTNSQHAVWHHSDVAGPIEGRLPESTLDQHPGLGHRLFRNTRIHAVPCLGNYLPIHCFHGSPPH